IMFVSWHQPILTVIKKKGPEKPKSMDEKNSTKVKEFVLSGFTADLQLQKVFFVIFLIIYVISLLGNMTLISLICAGTWLHTPMYFFIGNLSFLDLWYSSVYVPKILVTCISDNKSISFAGCLAQFLFAAGLAYSECYLLATMAYDRYVAISSPLLYSQAMSPRLCASLVAASYLGGFLSSAIITSETFTLSFCGNIIDDFFCDLPPLVKLACDVKESLQAVLYFILASNVIAPFVLIVASYLFIIAAILRIRSAQGRLKAFSTCASHLMAVTLYYGSILYIYSRPSTSYALERDKVVSVFYTVVIPMLNPLIYSLRNKDVKDAVRIMMKANGKREGYKVTKWNDLQHSKLYFHSVTKQVMTSVKIIKKAPEKPKSMDEKNSTKVKVFVLSGFTADLQLQKVFFVIFLIIYVISLLGNMTLISLICADTRLHTPMYFFIGSLSFLDLWYSFLCMSPKILVTCISDNKSISFAGCLAQFFFSAGLAYSECYLLAAMAYDRYVAISSPLLYSQAMSPRLCASLVAASYIGGFLNSTIITSETFTLSFCGNNVIDDFFCDLPPLVKLACDV
ncbi:Olfactory Receptor 9G9, partial [Manis pentadactyla]